MLQPLVELLNSKNSESESAQRQTRHMHRSGNCRVLLQTVWFDWRRLEVNSKKDEYMKANFDFNFERFRIRLHVVLCRVCKPQLIVPHAKGHAVWQCQPAWRRQVWRRTSQSVYNSVCLWLSLCMCVYVSVSVCVCACLGVGVRLIVLVCLAGSFKPRCIRAGALHNSLFASQQANTLRERHTVFSFSLASILLADCFDCANCAAKFNYVYLVNAGKLKVFKEVLNGWR